MAAQSTRRQPASQSFFDFEFDVLSVDVARRHTRQTGADAHLRVLHGNEWEQPSPVPVHRSGVASSTPRSTPTCPASPPTSEGHTAACRSNADVTPECSQRPPSWRPRGAATCLLVSPTRSPTTRSVTASFASTRLVSFPRRRVADELGPVVRLLFNR